MSSINKGFYDKRRRRYIKIVIVVVLISFLLSIIAYGFM
jgi:hypothetical protein